jgi:hypothetical protein
MSRGRQRRLGICGPPSRLKMSEPQFCQRSIRRLCDSSHESPKRTRDLPPPLVAASTPSKVVTRTLMRAWHARSPRCDDGWTRTRVMSAMRREGEPDHAASRAPALRASRETLDLQPVQAHAWTRREGGEIMAPIPRPSVPHRLIAPRWCLPAPSPASRPPGERSWRRTSRCRRVASIPPPPTLKSRPQDPARNRASDARVPSMNFRTPRGIGPRVIDHMIMLVSLGPCPSSEDMKARD